VKKKKIATRREKRREQKQKLKKPDEYEDELQRRVTDECNV